MGLKIIGAGFGRTGTGSLRDALETLGYSRCYHMFAVAENPGHVDLWYRAGLGEAVDWDDLFGDKFTATTDWPGAAFYKDMLAQYPDAKVILTLRDPDKWYESARNSIYAISRATGQAPWLRWLWPKRAAMERMIRTVIWDGTFHGRFDDPDYAKAIYRAHIEEVKQVVPESQLLLFSVTEGWAPLCRFLGQETPDQPFPHANETPAMKRILWRRRLMGWGPPAAALLAALLVATLA